MALRFNQPKLTKKELQEEIFLDSVAQGILEYVMSFPRLFPEHWDDIQYRVSRKIEENTKTIWKG